MGDSGVGKSCCLTRFTDDSFTPSFMTTIGIDFKVRNIELDGKIVGLQIWDTAGQERFRTITKAYYRGAMGILLVYDVTDQKSFLSKTKITIVLLVSTHPFYDLIFAPDVRTWNSKIDQHANNNAHKILIGNKCDRMDERAVSSEQGQRLAEELNMSFMEVSAKGNINIENSFYSLASDIKEAIEYPRHKHKDIPDNNVDLDIKSLNGVKKGKCC